MARNYKAGEADLDQVAAGGRAALEVLAVVDDQGERRERVLREAQGWFAGMAADLNALAAAGDSLGLRYLCYWQEVDRLCRVYGVPVSARGRRRLMEAPGECPRG